MSIDLKQQVNHLCDRLIEAAVGADRNLLELVLTEQKAFIASHRDILDQESLETLRSRYEQALLSAKLVRAHCLQAISGNQRSLSILNAYREAQNY